MNKALLIILSAGLVAGSALAQDKPKIAGLSFGDYLENKTWIPGYKQNLHTKAKIEESLRQLKDAGYSTIWWRMLWEGAPDEDVDKFSYRVQAEKGQLKKEFEKTPFAWDPHELRWPVAVSHHLGMKFYAWVVPYNMGAPPGAYAALGVNPLEVTFPGATIEDTEFPWMFKFARKNPQYQLVDRQGKRHHYGVMEWGYPEARRYWTALIKDIVDRYDVDGIYMDTRTECMSPDFADEFGFNEPVVEEYRHRYGVDIRTEDFDLEKWRQLRGEYFTQFLKEVSEVIHAKGKAFALGTARGDYIGFPLGNMKLEWRKWIAERVIDELLLDPRGWAWGRHGYGYLTDRDTGRGLRPVEDMVKKDYSPLCRKHGVKLYFRPGLYDVKDAEWKARVAAMPEFDGVVESPVFR